MRLNRYVCALATAFFAAHASSQWSKEPEAVFGMRLGAPVGEMECSRDGGPPPGACLKHGGIQNELAALVDQVPDLGFPNVVLAQVVDGRLASISIHLAQRDFDRMAAILVERYGRPQSDEVETLTNRMGAKFASRKMMWTGKRVGIRARERAGSVDRAAVNFAAMDIIGAQMKDQRKADKEAASKL